MMPIFRTESAASRPLLWSTTRALFAFTAALGLAACGDSNTAPPPPAAINAVGELALSGVVGDALTSPLTVKVTDANGSPVERALVTFTVAEGGGTVSKASDSTNARGEASTTWRLGERTVAQRVTARVTGVTGEINFVAVARAAAPATVGISAGDAQSAAGGATVAAAPAVIIRDRFTNPVPGISVAFTVAAGGGTVLNPGATTDNNGVASSGSWRLGTAAGANRLTALVLANGVTGNPITFNATATAGAATAVQAQTATAGITAAVGALVTPRPSVRVVDAAGNPVAGASVVFTASAGSSVVGGTKVTDAAGVASPDGWQLGSIAQAYTLTATVANLTPVVFSAVAQPGAAARVAIRDGNSQLVGVGRPVPIDPSVRVSDDFDNPVAGVPVLFDVTVGGGSAVGRSTVTNAQGIATVGGWTVGDAVGLNSLRATVSGTGIAGNPVVFTATATAGVAASMVVSAGNAQSGPAGFALPIAPAVLVRDNRGNPVAGVAVTFTTGTLSGSVTGGTAISGTNGIAAVTAWTLGSVAGTQTLVARSAGLADVTFTATGAAGPVSSITPFSGGTSLVGAVGAAVVPVPSVRVLDANGNAVVGQAVTFAASAGSNVDGALRFTDANGVASPTSWTLGNVAQTYTLTASVPTLPSVVFSAAARPGAPTRVTIQAGNNQTAAVGRPVTIDPSVRVSDAFDNPVAGVEVVFEVTQGGGLAVGRSPVTNAQGIATVGGWTLGDAVGANALRATVTGAGISGNPVLFSATTTPGAAAGLIISAGNAQTAVAGFAVQTAPAVVVRDSRGNPVAGVTVVFSPGTLSGSVTGGTVVSGANGVAAVTAWTLGPVAGTQTLVARSTGLPDVTFTATATAGPASSVSAFGGTTTITGSVGAAVTPVPSVRVLDANGNAVAGATVTFTSSAGSTVSGGSRTTDATGVAAPTSWTLGTTAQVYTLTATVGTLPSVVFSATARATTATQVTVSAGNNQSAAVGSPVAIEPAVRVTDNFGNPVSGVEVVFDVATGGGTVVGRRPLTNADGVAVVGGWTLGVTIGANTLTATVTGSGITGNPVTFTATGVAGQATTMVAQSGDAQTGTVGAALALPPTVVVRDSRGNPVAGVVVTFTPAAGNGTVGSSVVTTNASGIAATTWTLAGTVGAKQLTASATGLPSVVFTATGTASTASQIAVLTGAGQTAVVGTALAVQPTVVLRDAFNNPVAGVTVTFTPAANNGTVGATTAVTNASGIASPGIWTLGTAAGTQTLGVTAGSLSASITAVGTAGAAASIAVAPGSTQLQFATASQAVATVPAVRVVDAFGNPVAGVTITFTPNGGTTVGAGSVVTDANGVASAVSWTMPTGSATRTLTATAAGGGIANNPFTFSAVVP